MEFGKNPNGKEFDLENIQEISNSPLKGKTIYWLGSSVTKGEASEGLSMADYLAKRNNLTSVKSVISGSTMFGANEETSYVFRVEYDPILDRNKKIDAFICQISTNDSNRIEARGNILEGIFDKTQFDKNTTAGAIEFIISYVHEVWGCPIYFYSGSYFGKDKYDGDRDAPWCPGDRYQEVIDLVKKAIDKYSVQPGYQIALIDLFNDDFFNQKASKEAFKWYMKDPIHPTKAGYLIWWTPYFEEYLLNHICH